MTIRFRLARPAHRPSQQGIATAFRRTRRWWAVPPLPSGLGARSPIRARGVATALLSGNELCSLFMRSHADTNAKNAASPDHPSIFTRQEWVEIRRSLGLSTRQAEIVCLLLEGHKIYAVAVTLGISPDTVRAHLRRLYRKLAVADRLDLVIRCFREFRRLSRPL